MEYVFDLSPNGDKRYFTSIDSNLKQLGLTRSDLYVQNLCRNYFTQDTETIASKVWAEIACRWCPFLVKELDNLFDRKVPVLLTAARLYRVLNKGAMYEPKALYGRCLFVPEKDSRLGRVLIPLFRICRYRLTEWPEYARRVRQLVASTQ